MIVRLLLAALSVLFSSVPARGQAVAAEARVTVADGIVLGLSMFGVKTTDADTLRPRVHVKDGEIYRVIVDQTGRARFAYAVRVNPAADRIDLLFRPVRFHEVTWAFVLPSAPPFRVEGSLPTFATAQSSSPITGGDVINLELFEHANSGQRIGDRIRVISVSRDGVNRLAALRRQQVEEPPTLTFASLTIRRNGEIISSSLRGSSASGRVVGAGLGSVGTVLFSVDPPAGEAPYGIATIDGRTLSFSLDGHDYEFTSIEPIGPDGVTSVWLYVERKLLPYRKGYWVGAGNSLDAFLKEWRDNP